MSRSYNITRSLLFNSSTGYWVFNISVNSSINLNPRVFLVEKYVSAGESIATSANTTNYVRCLLRNEPISVSDETDTSERPLDGWVSHRTNTISRSFYTYEEAVKSQSSILATLKSNTEDYKSLKPTKEPRLVVINMSSKDKIPTGGDIEAYKGDVISLQLVNGPRCEQVVSDKAVLAVGGLSLRRVTSNSISIKLLDNSHTKIGLRDSDTSVEYTVGVTMLSTDEAQVTENL